MDEELLQNDWPGLTGLGMGWGLGVEVGGVEVVAGGTKT